MDFSGIPEDKELLDFVFFTFLSAVVLVPGKERLCALTSVPSFRSYFLTWTGLTELELFDFDEVLFEK